MTKAADPSSSVPSASPLESSWTNDPLNYVVRVFAAFLQTIFEDAPRGAFHWAPKLEDTEIVVTEENPVNLDVTERKPAISLVLGPVQFNGSSLDEFLSRDSVTGKEVHTDLIPGTMTLNCLSRVAQEARFIAWLSARTIWNLRKILVRDTFIHEVGRKIFIGSVTPAGALVQGDTEAEWHVVPVQCPFYLQWTDSVTPLDKDWTGEPIRRVTEIQNTIQTQMSKLPRVTQTIRPPRRRGREIVRPPQPGGTSSPLDMEIKV